MTTLYTTSSTLTPSLGALGRRLLVAEAVLPGHPDKLADQIADGIVDIALAADPQTIVQIEVAVHDQDCFVNGRCSTASGPLPREDIERTVRAVYERAGFGVLFPGVGEGADYQCPRGDDVNLSLSLQLDVADPMETAEREFADDQAITIGYAVATPATRFLPLEQHLALALRRRLLELCATRRELGAGPDGKLVAVLLPTGAESPRFEVREVIVSLQHVDGAPLSWCCSGAFESWCSTSSTLSMRPAPRFSPSPRRRSRSASTKASCSCAAGR